jgi:hypothetical protein
MIRADGAGDIDVEERVASNVRKGEASDQFAQWGEFDGKERQGLDLVLTKTSAGVEFANGQGAARCLSATPADLLPRCLHRNPTPPRSVISPAVFLIIHLARWYRFPNAVVYITCSWHVCAVIGYDLAAVLREQVFKIRSTTFANWFVLGQVHELRRKKMP